jgi:ATP/maltotriose-dependent transcriptional regulator MalT/DNA-binding SARP family transcriptional activator
MKVLSENKKQLVNLAKVTRHSASKILLRQRLFERLKGGKNAPIIWVAGPAGSGKTTLVSSYVESQNLPCLWYKIDSKDIDLVNFYFNLRLAGKKTFPEMNTIQSFLPDYHSDIQDFNHNFFTTLFSNITKPSVLVLDNYQEIPEEILLHDLLLEAFNLLPENCRIIIISRKEPLAKFSRLRINRRMFILRWEDLRFTSKEFQDVINNWGFEDIPEKLFVEIYQRLDGWIAGLLFMLEGTNRYNTSIQHVGIGAIEDIFNYFSEEVYDYLDNEIKHFLLTTSLLPYITVHLAHKLSGVSQAAKILNCLARNNLFIEKLAVLEKDTFQYVPIFGEFLQSKLAETYAPEKLNKVKRTAATLLLAENQIEAAAGLLRRAEDWDGLLNIINQYAPLLISQQRTKLLQLLLNSIPPDIASLNSWLPYWFGVCQQQTNPAEAQKNFRKAFAVFCSQHDHSGSFAAWAGLIRSIISESNDFTQLDSLIDWLAKRDQDEFKNLCCEMRGTISACMVEALMIRRPFSRDLLKWIKYTTENVIYTDPDQAVQNYNVVVNYYLWLGDPDNALLYLEKTRKLSHSHKVSSLSILKTKCLEAQSNAWYKADTKKCIQTVEIGLDIAKFTGVHTMDHKLFALGAFGCVLDNNFSKAFDYLQKIEAPKDTNRKHSYFWYYYLTAWINILRGNVPHAIHCGKNAQKTAKASGHLLHKAMAHFITSQVFFEKGDFRKATNQLNNFGKMIGTKNSSLLDYLFSLTKAHFAHDLGKEQVGIKYLKKAMKLGREGNYCKLMCWWDPKIMTRLSMKALEREIETSYVKDLIKHQGLTPVSSPIEIEQWPWPVKIYTLGRFEIVKKGTPLRFKGKAQQKPLAMLKALIALGGRGVSEFHLAEALWPDSDGDMQHQSLATTLHRLRRILGENDLIEFQDNHLSIKSRSTWVDIWAFERLLSHAETEAGKNEGKSPFLAARYAERAINLYKGSFLPQNSMDYWSMHLRERLKSRFLRGVIFLGRNLEKIGARDKAVLQYHKALEIDPLVEEFYQRIMICYNRMGRNVDAVRIFKRCEKNLQSMLNIEPSIQTEAILKNLIGKTLKQHNTPNLKKEKFLQM